MLDEIGRGVDGLFRASLAWGLIAGLVAAAVRMLVPATRAVVTPGLAAVVAVAVVLGVPLVAVVGVVGAVVEWRWPQWRSVAAAVAVPVAALLAVATMTRRPTTVAVTLAVVALTWAVLASAWRRGRPACGLALLTALGWYAGLPDTEGALVVVGALAVSLAVVSEVGWAPFAAAGAAVVLVGSAGRFAAVVGALVCLGLLLAPPPSSFWARAQNGEGGAGWRAPAVMVGVHAALVVYGARVVGRPQPPARALLLAAPALAVVAAVWVVDRHRRDR